MTYVTLANAKKLDMKHYIEKMKEHDKNRLSFNKRMEYWKNYFNEIDKTISK